MCVFCQIFILNMQYISFSLLNTKIGWSHADRKCNKKLYIGLKVYPGHFASNFAGDIIAYASATAVFVWDVQIQTTKKIIHDNDDLFVLRLSISDSAVFL